MGRVDDGGGGGERRMEGEVRVGGVNVVGVKEGGVRGG